MAKDPDLNRSPPDEPPFDPHLRAALRHAPDHDAAPPAALSEAIRAAAHAAVPAPPKPAPWWQRWWQASGRPQGPWGAALASLAVVAVTLGLWFGQQIPPPVAPRASTPVEAPVVTSGTTKVAQAQAADAPAKSAEAAGPAAPAPPNADRARAPAQRVEAPARPPVAPPPRMAPAQGQTAATPEPVATAETSGASPAPAPAPVLAPVPSAAPAAAMAPAPAPPVADLRSRNGDQTALRAAAGTTMPKMASPDTAAQDATAKAAPAAPLRSLQRRLTAMAASLQWRDGEAAPEAAGAAAQAWLQALDAAAVGRWHTGSGPLQEGVGRRLRWLQDDRPIAEAQVLANGVRFIDHTDGSTWYVELPAPVLDTLRQR